MSDPKQIASIILQQIGGNKFIAMTGACQLTALSESAKIRGGLLLKFKGSKVANYLKVELTPLDTYDMTFTKVWGGKHTEAKKYEGVYCNQLEELFQDTTGLATRL